MWFVEETITPSLARKYLGKNIPNNRNVSEEAIATYASDMLAGDWVSDTGDNIKFDTKDDLIDGQQRLMAVIKADITVKMWVSYGVSEDALPVIDTGRSRTFAHTLKMQDAINPTRSGAIVKWVYLFDKGYPCNKGSVKPSHTQLNKLYKTNPTSFIEASRRADDIKRTGMAVSGAGGVAYYLFNRISPTLAHSFFDQLISGANVPKKSPILILRNRLFRASRDRVKPYEVLALYVRAWNNFLEDNAVGQLFYTGTDKKMLNNSNFPTIKIPK